MRGKVLKLQVSAVGWSEGCRLLLEIARPASKFVFAVSKDVV